MSEFRTSQILPDEDRYNDGKPIKNSVSELKNNTLVVVVTKAQGLRNVLKMDKQSPFITVRVQDQEESTKVVARGGQTPTFNNELWFNLDGIEEKTLYINAYHQRKNDSKLICSGEVDFSTALKKSTTEGYDDWFTLYWEGREAGRVYLEMTYYPRRGEVPLGTENAARIHMNQSMLSRTANNISFGNSLKEKTRRQRNNDTDNIPELGQLNLNKTKSLENTNNRFAQLEKRYRQSRSRSGSPNHSPSKRDAGKSSNDKNEIIKSDSSSTGNTGGNWLSFLDNTIKLPSLLNNLTFNTNNTHTDDTDKRHIDEGIESRVKLKVESPDIIQERPKKLFDSDNSSDEDCIDYNGDDVTETWKKSIASRQEPIYRDQQTKIHSLSYRRDDFDESSDEEYTLGESIDLTKSFRKNHIRPNNSSPRRMNYAKLDDDELSRSYQNKNLPSIGKLNHNLKNIKSVEDDEDDIPPPPPKHMISMGSLFDSTITSRDNANDTKQRPDLFESASLTNTKLNDQNSGRTLSWYDKRKLERRRQR